MRNFINIVEGADRYIYHGTSLRSLEGIREEGLQPSSPPQPEGIWPEFDEEDDDDMPEEAYEKRLFATPSFRAASGYAENNIDGIVLRFPETPDWEIAFSELDTYLYSTTGVLPEKIEMFVDGEWKPLK